MTTATATRVVTMHGQPIELVGHEVKVNSKAPEFVVIDSDLHEVRLSDIHSPVVVLSAVPSLDTKVCDMETRRFNQEADRYGGDVKIVTLSMDLPFAQKRWCAAAGVQNVQVLSDYRDASFGSAYGVLMKDLRLLARCVFVLDANRTVQYVQLVKEVTNEPDYDDVLEAVRKLR